MNVEPDTASEDVTDNDDLSEHDTPEDYDYFDPDEDEQDNEAAEQSDGTDDEADEADEAEEGDDDQESGEADEEEPIEGLVEKLKAESPRLAEYLGELEKGNLRQADYTRKQQALSNERETVKADVQRMQRITDAFVDHISGLVPEAPDASLALSNPAAYTAQKAQHEAAMAQVQKLIELGQAPTEVASSMSEADQKIRLQEANAKLIEMFPEAADGEGRQEFFGNVQQVANDLGFSNEELGQIDDPRVFALAHWARKGMEADKAKAKAKAKVAKAPPATPRKPGQGARKANGNAEAMRKLNRTGSLRDAMAIDFD